MDYLCRILIALLLFSSEFASHAQQSPDDDIMAVMNHPEYIEASLLVVSPGKAVYSAGGHLAIRMQCPSKDIDYTYQFNAIQTRENQSFAAAYFSGRLTGEYIRSYTADFIGEVKAEQRSITELPMHLTPQQEVKLWSMLDDAVDAPDNSHPFNPVYNNCCAMTLRFVGITNIDEGFNDINSILVGSSRRYLEDYFGDAKWTGLAWNLVLGSEFDKEKVPLFLLYPRRLGFYLSRVTVKGSGDFLIDNNEYYNSHEWRTSYSMFTPTLVFAILLAIAVLLSEMSIRRHSAHRACRVFDTTLIIINAIIGLVLWYQQLFAEPPVSTFNEMALFFTPLSLLLLIRSKAISIAQVILLAYFTVVAFYYSIPGTSPQAEVYDMWLAMAVYAIRGASHIAVITASVIKRYILKSATTRLI